VHEPAEYVTWLQLILDTVLRAEQELMHAWRESPAARFPEPEPDRTTYTSPLEAVEYDSPAGRAGRTTEDDGAAADDTLAATEDGLTELLAATEEEAALELVAEGDGEAELDATAMYGLYVSVLTLRYQLACGSPKHSPTGTANDH
jgi:hypothetical protein